MESIILYGAVLWNIVVFIIYGIDKYKAIRGKWRISEKTLISAAFLMGAPGAVCGMYAFRHKLGKRRFVNAVRAALAVNVAAVALLGIMAERY